MISLISNLHQVSCNEIPSRLPHRSQPSKEFSLSQNLRLYCEAFKVNYALKPFGTIDWAKIEDKWAQSWLYSVMKPQDMKQRSFQLMKHLLIVHLRDALVSRSDIYKSAWH